MFLGLLLLAEHFNISEILLPSNSLFIRYKFIFSNIFYRHFSIRPSGCVGISVFPFDATDGSYKVDSIGRITRMDNFFRKDKVFDC